MKQGATTMQMIKAEQPVLINWAGVVDTLDYWSIAIGKDRAKAILSDLAESIYNEEDECQE